MNLSKCCGSDTVGRVINDDNVKQVMNQRLGTLVHEIWMHNRCGPTCFSGHQVRQCPILGNDRVPAAFGGEQSAAKRL